jgi:hypothetical protein
MTQATTATVTGAAGGKSYSDTATNGAWDGNNLLDTISSSDLGFVQAGQVIDHVCVTYTAGACIWRIQDRSTLAIKRWGYASKVGTVDLGECSIPAYTIMAEDILTTYPLAMDATANQSAILGWLQTSKGPLAFGGQNIVDSTATEITSLVTAQSLGEFFGSILTGVTLQVEDAASLTSVSIIGADGGTIIRWLGTVRDAAHYYANLHVSCSIPIDKGTVIKVTTVTA